MTKTVDQIISACGGFGAVTTALGIAPPALRKWRQFGAPPSRHHLALMRLSGGALNVADFPPSAQRKSGADRTRRERRVAAGARGAGS